MSTVITCVGTAVLDHVYRVDKLPSREGKHFAESYHQIGGGPAASAAVAISRLGGAARFVGGVGSDDAGDQLVAELAAEGVDTHWIARSPDHPSPTSAVIIDGGGERMIVNHTDQETMSDLESLVVEAVAGAAAVLTDLRWASGCEAALAAAAAAGITAIVDYDMSDTTIGEEVLDLASHIVFSAPALAALTGLDDRAAGLLAIRESSPAWLAVTAGNSGTNYLADKEPVQLPAFPVDVVDTLGAGDVFHGAFALGIGRGLSPDQALIGASAAAAIKCSRPGGRAASPTRSELTTFMKEHGHGTDTW
jgi:sulfofructose kinase